MFTRDMETTPATTQPDAVARYGFERTEQGARCIHCGAEFRKGNFGVGGDVMRSHARKCSVEPRQYHVPGVCDA